MSTIPHRMSLVEYNTLCVLWSNSTHYINPRYSTRVLKYSLYSRNEVTTVTKKLGPGIVGEGEKDQKVRTTSDDAGEKSVNENSTGGKKLTLNSHQ
jgi:hypothetical protein